MLYADGVRKLRQREYDNVDLYSDTETAQAEQKERSQQNFIEYFGVVLKKRHANSSESIIVNWRRIHELLKIFTGEYLPFSKIDNRLAEDFRTFMLSAPCGGNKGGTVSQNTAATYFSIFKAALKQAFVDGYLTTDLSAKIKGIQEQESRREYLTVEELNTLAATPCERDVLKRSALFSALQDCGIATFKNFGGKKSAWTVTKPACILHSRKPKAWNIRPFPNKPCNCSVNVVNPSNWYLKIYLTPLGFPNRSKSGWKPLVLKSESPIIVFGTRAQPFN